ncbi:translation machinery-associated protein 16 isoform X4 [Emydura macquarii macquarii]|uniref:translation machinery-associated protein 16 isoform X4 n=1 Tax=Emydura macquarii macquarii TaxID=1129001 RepID=UPI00352BC2BA
MEIASLLGQPKVPKGRGGGEEKKVIHPYSRKAAQLTREAHKQEKKEKACLHCGRCVRLHGLMQQDQLSGQWRPAQLIPEVLFGRRSNTPAPSPPPRRKELRCVYQRVFTVNAAETLWLKNEKALRLSIVGEKLQWFQSHLDPSKADYSKKEACELIERHS